MAITLEDFGLDVDQVQGKLNDLLPNIDTGLKVIKDAYELTKSHSGSQTGILGEIDSGALASIDYSNRIYDTCEKIDPDIDNAFVDGKKLLDGDLKQSNELEGELKSAHETLESELKNREEKVSSAAVALETNLNLVQQNLGDLTTSWSTLESSFTKIRAEVTLKISEASTSHIEHHENLIKELMNFEGDGFEKITQSGTGPLTLFADTMSDMKSAADKTIADVRKELDEILDNMQTDRQAVTQGFCDQYRTSVGLIPGPLGDLANKAVGQLQDCKNDSLGKLQTEVGEAQSDGEKAKSMLEGVAPKVTDVKEVQRTAADMNQAM